MKVADVIERQVALALLFSVPDHLSVEFVRRRSRMAATNIIGALEAEGYRIEVRP